MTRDSVSQTVLVLRISVCDSDPEIWHRIVVPSSFSLHDLHQTIQTVLGWQERHLYMFEVGDDMYEESPEDRKGIGSRRKKLSSLQLRTGNRFRYVYDFGDDWSLEILVEDLPSELPLELPWLMDGGRAAPIEDSGGIGGYSELVAAHEARMRGESLSDDDLERLEWAGTQFHPEFFDIEAARRNLRSR